jgi:serine/threonine protein kinase
MFESETSSEIKVLDFGLSKKFLGKPGIMTERVGTIYTMAPQVHATVSFVCNL